MKQPLTIFCMRWVVPILLLLTFLILPDLVIFTGENDFSKPNILTRILLVFFLSHPYLSAAQIISRLSGPPDDALAMLFIKGPKDSMPERIFGRAVYILITSAVMFFALRMLFPIYTLLRFIIPIIYGISVTLLQWDIENFKKIKK